MEQELIDLCRKLIKNRSLPLEETHLLISSLSQLLDEAQIQHLHRNYPDQKPVPALLLEVMRQHRLTRRQFARELGISYYQLGVLMRGESQMSMDTAKRLMRFGIDANFILKNN